MISEWFVYWHADPVSAAEALAAARDFQRCLRDTHPGLVARLYRREEPARGRITVMETYAAPGGLDAAVEAAVEVAIEAAILAPAWCPGIRHCERFEPV